MGLSPIWEMFAHPEEVHPAQKKAKNRRERERKRASLQHQQQLKFRSQPTRIFPLK